MFYALLGIIVCAIVGLDQWVKWLTIQNIPKHTVGEPVLGLFRLAHHRNTGAAWSMLEGQTWFFLAVLVVFVLVVAFMIWKKWLTKKVELLCMASILGGAFGNAIDRLFRNGEVVDMIKFNFWMDFPTFNVADIFICVGCFGLMVYILCFDDETPLKAPKSQKIAESDEEAN
ncbi:MAG: signal peptidase II [Oscillospiraceae bacterium]|nr:signal peptidase II [Oscillospiraceae bacterium]